MRSQIISASSLQMLHFSIKLQTKLIKDNLLVSEVSLTVTLKLNHTFWHSPRLRLGLHDHSYLSNMSEASHYGKSKMSYHCKHTSAAALRSINLIRLILMD